MRFSARPVRRFVTRKRDAEPELRVDWPRIADGRARRLRRGVDFSGPASALAREAQAAAASMDMSVLVVPDRLRREEAIWVQFAAGEIRAGEACRCGSRRLRRLTRSLVECCECRATLVFQSDPEPAPASRKAARARAKRAAQAGTLGDLSQLRLVHAEDAEDARRYVGFAVGPEGERVVVAVREPKHDGRPIPDPSSPTGTRLELLVSLPVQDAKPALDPPDADWSLVVE